MVILLIILGTAAALGASATLLRRVSVRNRDLIARAEIQARQRRADAAMAHLVQDTIQQMLDVARRQR